VLILLSLVHWGSFDAGQNVAVPLGDWSSLVAPVDDWQSLAVLVNDWQSLNAPIHEWQNFASPMDLIVPINAGQGHVVPSNLADSLIDPAIPGRHPCKWCNASFGRKADRDRHVKTKHTDIQYHLCDVAGCPKSRGSNKWKGYSRFDKLQEHRRNKHAAANDSGTNA